MTPPPEDLSPDPGPPLEGDFPTEALLGERIGGRYRIERVLGHGGMGAVYEARTDDGQAFALKVIRPDVHKKAGREAVRRFLREAKAAERIASPYVARVVDAGNDDARRAPFLVMELLHGRDLARVLRERGPLDPAGVVPLFVQACAGLTAAHACGVVHRDIKPANIFVQDLADGRIAAKLCDFGVAKQTQLPDDESELTRSGGVVGSPLYMSPEQARSAKGVDHRTDVFSLAVSLYEALTGIRPWQASSIGQMVFAMWSTEPRALNVLAPWIDPALAIVVHRALARDPAQRTPTAAAFGEALAPFGGGELTLASLRGISEERRAQLREAASMTWSDLAAASTVPTSAGATPSAAMIEPARQAPPRRRWWLVPTAVLVCAATGAGWALRERPPAKWWTGERATVAIPIAAPTGVAENACAPWLPRAVAEGTSADIVAGGKVRALGPRALAQIFGRGAAAGSTLRQDFGVDAVVEARCTCEGDEAKVQVRVVSTDTPPRALASFRASGRAAAPSALVTTIAAKLRAALGLPVPPDEELARAAHPLPASAEGTRDYVTALERLDASDPSAAREPLERVARAEPAFSPAHQALSEALAATGREADAAREAGLAAKNVASLPNEERLIAEGDAASAGFQWGPAVETYRAVIRVFPDRTDVAIRLVRLLLRAGRYREGREATDALLAADPRAAHDPRVGLAQAKTDAMFGDFGAAVDIASRLRTEAQAGGLERVEVEAAEAECNARTHLQDPTRTEQSCADAWALEEKLGDHALLITHLLGDSHMAALRGAFGEARAALDRAMAIAEVEQNEHYRSVTLNARANITKREGNLPAAIADARAAIVAADAAGEMHDRASSRILLAGTLLDSGIVDEAAKNYEEAVAIARASGEDEARAIALQNLGGLWMTKGDVTRAAAAANEALSLQEKMGDELDLLWTLDSLGEIEIEAGEPAKARARFEATFAQREKLKLPTTGSRADLALALLDEGDREGAMREASAAVADADRGQSMETQVGVRLPLALVLLAQGRPGDALAVVDRALELGRSSGFGTEGLTPIRVRALFLAGRTREALAAAKTPLTTPQAQREMRLVADEIAIHEGRREAAVRDLQALASEAHAAGHVRIERRANGEIARAAGGG